MGFGVIIQTFWKVREKQLLAKLGLGQIWSWPILVWPNLVSPDEQGNPLMPLLFKLGVHDSEREVRRRLIPEDSTFAHLDDMYVVSQPVTTREGCDVFERQLMAGAGAMACGQEASRFSALQLVRPSSRTASLRRDWKMSRDSGRQ